jgi:hypothetical protein
MVMFIFRGSTASRDLIQGQASLSAGPACDPQDDDAWVATGIGCRTSLRPVGARGGGATADVPRRRASLAWYPDELAAVSPIACRAEALRVGALLAPRMCSDVPHPPLPSQKYLQSPLPSRFPERSCPGPSECNVGPARHMLEEG